MARVLVVDDDDGLLFLIGEFLDACGIDFQTAECVPEARQRLGKSRFDMVISDLHMPGESGFDLFRHVTSRYPHIRFVLMTGCLDSRIRREALKMGIWNYIEKPFQFGDLIRLIRNVHCCQDVETQLPASA